jgi:coenzyme F420-reducing hydrogenase beta subunit
MKAELSPKDIVDSGMCIGCGTCVTQSKNPQVKMSFDNFGHLKPYGPADWYEKSSIQISQACPFSPKAANEDELARELFPNPIQKDISVGHFQNAYVGYANQDEFRAMGSSGGMVSWVATELLRMDLIDGLVHVVPSETPDEEGNFFHFSISRTAGEILRGAKSRYYPTELSKVLEIISKEPGRYAIVGVPCFVKAIQLLRKHDEIFRDRIRFTLGLFCGHMKSSRLVESFAAQMKTKISAVAKVEFRFKFPDRAAYWYNARLTLKNGSVVNKDWRYLVDGDWGAGYFMNSACNYCDDVVAEIADISFGDAWVEPYALDGLGTNVIVVRSNVVMQLISNGIDGGKLALTEVDGDFIARTQEAGLRQRREGLAYRLTWNNTKVKPEKRIAPHSKNLSYTRKIVYLTRFYISIWSNYIFLFSNRLNFILIYLAWARISMWIYRAIVNYNSKSK